MIAASAPALAHPSIGHRRHLALSSFWFGLFAIWTPVALVLVPAQVNDLVAKGYAPDQIAFVIGSGAIFSMIVPPLVGAWSDRLQTRFGRRRPILVAGALGTVVGLLLMLSANSVPWLVAGYVVLQIFSNGAAAAFFGLLPDIVPEHEFGKGSAYLGTMVQVGSAAGLVVTVLLNLVHAYRWSYAVLGAILLASLLPTLWAARGEGGGALPARSVEPLLKRIAGFFRPLAGGDFTLVFFTRMAMVAGFAAVSPYLYNFFVDVVRVSDAKNFTSTWLFLLLLVAGPSGYVGGLLSDRYGRKIFVYASGALQALVVVFFIVLYPTQVPIVLATALVFGIGYGLYYAVDWALACDTLPDRTSPAKDLGLFHVALTLPNSLVSGVAGAAIGILNRHSALSGYRWVFGTAAVFFLIGTVLVSRLKTVR